MVAKVYKIKSNRNYGQPLLLTRQGGGEDEWEITDDFGGGLSLVNDYLDISDYLLDQGIEVDERVELASMMEFDGGGLSIDVKYYGVLWTMIRNTDDIDDIDVAFVLELTEDSNPVYWGVIKKDSVSKDDFDKTISFECYNAAEFILDTFGDKVIFYSPDVTDSNFTIGTELSNIFYGDLISDISIDLPTGTPTGIDAQDLLAIVTAGKMTVKHFVEELQKQYGAYIYVTADKVLHFTNRSGGNDGDTATEIDDLILHDSIELETELKEYDSVLLNAYRQYWITFLFSPWSSGHATTLPDDDWILLYEDQGVQAFYTDGDVDRIPDKFNYLDMRQKLTLSGNDYVVSTDWKLYGHYEGGGVSTPSEFDPDAVWKLFNFFTHSAELLKCTVKGTSLSLFEKIEYNSQEYTVFELNKNYKTKTTSVVARRLLNTSITQEAE